MMMFQVGNLDELKRAIEESDHDDRLEILCKDIHTGDFKIVRIRLKDGARGCIELHEVREVK